MEAPLYIRLPIQTIVTNYASWVVRRFTATHFCVPYVEHKEWNYLYPASGARVRNIVTEMQVKEEYLGSSAGAASWNDPHGGGPYSTEVSL